MLFSIIFLLGFFIFFSLYGFWLATHPPRYITHLTPKDLGWEFEDVQVTTRDGIKLAAWFIPSVNKSDRVIILLHGYPADKANLLYWSAFLHDDFNLFFLDFRYFGDSEGSLTTIGYKEQQDLKATIDHLANKGYVRIGAMGFSLGGSVAILTASEDDRIKAIVSDSAFANIELMGNEFYKPLWVLKYPLTLLTKLWAMIFLGINANDVAPEKAAVNLKIPVLLIHSKKDETIPFENAKRLEEALSSNPKAQFFFLEEGTHGHLPPDILGAYQKNVLEFFRANLWRT